MVSPDARALWIDCRELSIGFVLSVVLVSELDALGLCDKILETMLEALSVSPESRADCSEDNEDSSELPSFDDFPVEFVFEVKSYR